MDLSERQPEQRESFSDVYVEVLTPVCCGELTELTTTWTKTRMRADRIREHLFSFLTLTDGASKSFVGMRQTVHTL